jgi:aspartyl-tRNA(Asn)/glutamyl-tRNA(Gln) amidotransferase subunit B
METSGKLTATQAKKVLGEIVARGGDADPAAIASELGYKAVDAGALESLVDELLAANPAQANRLRAGDQKVIGFFVGAAMKATNGNADGKAVTSLLRARASSS